jgi:hypothetical protein
VTLYELTRCLFLLAFAPYTRGIFLGLMDDFRPLLHERPWLLNTAIVKIGHRESADFEVGLNFEGKKDYAIHHSWGGGVKNRTDHKHSHAARHLHKL